MASISGISSAANNLVSQAVSSGSITIATCTVCGQTPCICSDSDTANGTAAAAVTTITDPSDVAGAEEDSFNLTPLSQMLARVYSSSGY